MHPDNMKVVCQVKISRAAMKALKKLQKQKSSTKGKKNNKIYPL
jgi:hypothetical protein